MTTRSRSRSSTSFKTELIADRVWRSRSQLGLAVVEYIGWFNDSRLHQALGDRLPSEFERLSQPSTLEFPSEGTNKPGLRETRSGSGSPRPTPHRQSADQPPTLVQASSNWGRRIAEREVDRDDD
jgi:hypothetical protein